MENTEKKTTISTKMSNVIQYQGEKNKMTLRRFYEMKNLLLIIKDKLGIDDPIKEQVSPVGEKVASEKDVSLLSQVSAIHESHTTLANMLANEIDIAMREISVISENIS